MSNDLYCWTGITSEQDLPESRSEYNEEYGAIELPSVNRLKAMFGGDKSQDKDSSIKRVSLPLPPCYIHSSQL